MVSEKVDQKILDRIANLLALANDKGATEAEAALAAQRAQELLLKYNLDTSAVSAQSSKSKGQQPDTTQRKVKMGVGKTIGFDWCLTLAAGIARTTQCAYVYYASTREIVFVGSPMDIQVACGLYEFLLKQGLSIAERQYKAENLERIYGVFRKFRYGFMMGFADRIWNRLYDAHNDLLRREDAAREQVEISGALVGAATALVRCKTDEAADYVFNKWGIDLNGKHTPKMSDEELDDLASKSRKKERERKAKPVDALAYSRGQHAGTAADLSHGPKLS
jgi:hypothetical protein